VLEVTLNALQLMQGNLTALVRFDLLADGGEPAGYISRIGAEPTGVVPVIVERQQQLQVIDHSSTSNSRR
jgi:hypothetical protein